MRTLILGAGGIGGYFGGRMAEVSADVTFLVREARAATLQAKGLVIESPLGDATRKVKTVTSATVDGPYDLVLISCKAYDLDSAIESIRPAVGPATSILPLLNGLAHIERLETVFGAETVLGGLAHISVTLAADGRIRHLSKLNSLTYGARTDKQKARCDAIEALFAPVAFEAKRSATIMQEMWEKYAFITAAAATTCLMRATIGSILGATEGEHFVLKMLGECEAVAAASGYEVRAKAQGWARTLLTQRGSDFTASMLRDIRNGAKVEADQLPGDMIKRGETLGIDVGLLRVAYCHLQAYENGRPAA